MEPSKTIPYFFLHIPRTAGTTLNSLLCRHFPPEKTLTVYSDAEYREHRYHTAEELAHIEFITGHLLLESTDPPRIYGMPVRVLTLLREPLGRLVSEYHFLRSWKSNHLYALLNDNNISFADYIRSRERRLFYRGKNFMTRCIAGCGVGDDPYPRAALGKAKHSLEDVFSFVGIQERFMESLVLLGSQLGMENLLHERRNALKHKDPVSEDDMALARECNRADCELYDFACALFAARVEAQGSAFARKVAQVEQLNRRYQKIAGLLYEQAVGPQQGDISLPKDGRW